MLSVFFSSKCSLFHNSNLFSFCIIHILYTGCAKPFIYRCAKIKKNNSSAKRLNKIRVNFRLQFRAMGQAVSSRERLDSNPGHLGEISGGPSENGQCLVRVLLLPLCVTFHHCSLFILFYQKEKRAKPENFPKGSALRNIREHFVEQSHHCFVFRLLLRNVQTILTNYVVGFSRF
jgi:hypothetical protein